MRTTYEAQSSGGLTCRIASSVLADYLAREAGVTRRLQRPS